MAIVVESMSADVAVDNDDTTLSPAVPAGTQDGDMLIAIGATAQSRIITAPVGWIQIIDNLGESSLPLSVWYKIASGESGLYGFTVGTYGRGHIVLLRLSGIDADTAPNGTAQGDATWDASIVCPDKEVITADSMLLWFCNSSLGTVTHTSDRGSEVYDVNDSFTVAVAVYSEIINGTGNQTGATITRSASINGKSGGVVLIAPTAGAAFKPAWAQRCNRLIGADV